MIEFITGFAQFLALIYTATDPIVIMLGVCVALLSIFMGVCMAEADRRSRASACGARH
ncbi:MAG: hypothetical protein HY457_01745 [Parcubacteria group bacterium]|nr:hypothetical protein [Parcubacteria group bacterium]